MSEKTWAHEIISTMTLEQKIGQLCMIQVPVLASVEEHENILHLITNYHIGGIFLHGLSHVEPQIKLVNYLQEKSCIPLLVGQDLEYGLSTHKRIIDGCDFPTAQELGTIEDETILYDFAKELAYFARAVGVHLPAVPVADVYTNPKNRIINKRAFGSTAETVCKKTTPIVRALNDAFVLSCAKHFPGHGDTSVDSHFDMPRIEHDSDRLKTCELVPFLHLVNNEIRCIMIGHLMVPALEKENIPATFSRTIITDLLKNEWQFEGLVITDALNMKAISSYYSPAEAFVRAFCAGNDIMLYPEDIPACQQALVELIKNDKSLINDLNNRVLKILCAKEWLGLHHHRHTKPVDAQALKEHARPIIARLDDALKKSGAALYCHATS